MASCLLLDLDETLCHTYPDIKSFIKLRKLLKHEHSDFLQRCYILDFFSSTGKRRQEHMWGVRRPHLDRFLRYAFEHWEVVAVYTAGTHDYAEALVHKLFGSLGLMPHYIFSREDCLPVIDEEGEVCDHVKPLKKILDDYPAFRNHIDLAKTVMIDNKANNFVCNDWMGLTIPDYAPPIELHLTPGDDDDTYLLGAIKLLKERRMTFSASRAVASRKKESASWWRSIVDSVAQ